MSQNNKILCSVRLTTPILGEHIVFEVEPLISFTNDEINYRELLEFLLNPKKGNVAQYLQSEDRTKKYYNFLYKTKNNVYKALTPETSAYTIYTNLFDDKEEEASFKFTILEIKAIAGQPLLQYSNQSQTLQNATLKAKLISEWAKQQRDTFKLLKYSNFFKNYFQLMNKRLSVISQFKKKEEIDNLVKTLQLAFPEFKWNDASIFLDEINKFGKEGKKIVKFKKEINLNELIFELKFQNHVQFYLEIIDCNNCKEEDLIIDCQQTILKDEIILEEDDNNILQNKFPINDEERKEYHEMNELLQFLNYCTNTTNFPKYYPLISKDYFNHCNELIENENELLFNLFNGNKKLANNILDFYHCHTIPTKDNKFNRDKGILLYGPPGTGKTTTLLECSKYFGLRLTNCVDLSSNRFITSLVGATSENIKMEANLSILFPYLLFVFLLDEVESIAPNKNNKHLEKHEADHLNTLLTIIADNTGIYKNIIVKGCTNVLEKVDEAFYRKGRVDKYFYVGPVSKNSKVFISNCFKQKFLNMDNSFDLKEREQIEILWEKIEKNLNENSFFEKCINFTISEIVCILKEFYNHKWLCYKSQLIDNPKKISDYFIQHLQKLIKNSRENHLHYNRLNTSINNIINYKENNEWIKEITNLLDSSSVNNILTGGTISGLMIGHINPLNQHYLIIHEILNGEGHVRTISLNKKTFMLDDKDTIVQSIANIYSYYLKLQKVDYINSDKYVETLKSYGNNSLPILLHESVKDCKFIDGSMIIINVDDFVGVMPTQFSLSTQTGSSFGSGTSSTFTTGNSNSTTIGNSQSTSESDTYSTSNGSNISLGINRQISTGRNKSFGSSDSGSKTTKSYQDSVGTNQSRGSSIGVGFQKQDGYSYSKQTSNQTSNSSSTTTSTSTTTGTSLNNSMNYSISNSSTAQLIHQENLLAIISFIRNNYNDNIFYEKEKPIIFLLIQDLTLLEIIQNELKLGMTRGKIHENQKVIRIHMNNLTVQFLTELEKNKHIEELELELETSQIEFLYKENYTIKKLKLINKGNIKIGLERDYLIKLLKCFKSLKEEEITLENFEKIN
ncbi:hypothetical protein ABK040_008534 [Willaertia magna]